MKMGIHKNTLGYTHMPMKSMILKLIKEYNFSVLIKCERERVCMLRVWH